MKKLKNKERRYKILSNLVLGSLFFTAGYLSAIYGGNIYTSIKTALIAPKVSVVMSTYNRDYAIAGAVESILNQTMKDFELIVVNDGSTDKTAEILDSYAKKDKRVVVITNEKNMGLVDGLNKGLDAARGKYIARMDDDDRAMPFRLERQFLAMEDHPEIAIMGAGFASGNEKKPTKKQEIVDPDIIELNTYFSSALAHPTIIIRKQFLDENNIRYDENYLYAEDCGLYKKVLEHGGKISSLKEPVLIFAHVKKVNRASDYGYVQTESFKKLQKAKLSPFFDAPYEILGAFNGEINRCIMLKEMVKGNKNKKILNQKILEDRYKNNCPQPGEETIYMSHPNWSSFVIFDENKKNIRRKDTETETAKILSMDNNYITIKWEKYPTPESFIKNNKNEYVFTNKIVIKNDKENRMYDVNHPSWIDKIIILKNKTFYRFSIPNETGKILKETKNQITIKWDNWPSTEIFQKDKEKLIFIKEIKKQ